MLNTPTCPERAIVGASLDVEAEYSCSASDYPFTYAQANDDEIYSVIGFQTLEAAIAEAKADFPAASVEVLG